jgi:hypothetical protein
MPRIRKLGVMMKQATEAALPRDSDSVVADRLFLQMSRSKNKKILNYLLILHSPNVTEIREKKTRLLKCSNKEEYLN